MADLRAHSSTSNIIRFTLKHSTTGDGLTGLSSATSGLIISTIADNEATATTYTVAGSTIETITTLGTFAAPTATKCRFKEVDATNHQGLYEFQFADARFSVANATHLVISVSGAANLLDGDYEIQLDADVNVSSWTATLGENDNYPAKQSQISGISVASAAQSVRVKPAPDGFVLTTGSEVNDEDSTVALDGVRHELTDAAGTFDGYYKFDIEVGAVPVSATIKAVVNGGNDTFGIYANIGSSSVPVWSQRLSITGTGTTTNDIYTVDLYSNDVVTDIPNEVWLRVYGTGLTTSSFDTDQMFVSRSFDIQYSGYDNGAVWTNTVGGKAGTTLGYNGIASRPTLTFADAITIGTSLNINRHEISNDSSITLAATTSNKILSGRGWTLVLANRDITNTHVLDAKASGIATGADVEFHDSLLTNVTMPNGAFHNCAVIGTFTCSSASTYHFHQSHSGDGTVPTIDLGAAVGATTLLMHNWKGAFNVDNLGATGADVINLAGDGEITLNASCVGGTLNYQGNWKFTNNGSGVTVNPDDNTASTKLILADTADMQPRVTVIEAEVATHPTLAEIEASTVIAKEATLGTPVTTISGDVAALNNITASEVLAAGDIDGYSLEEAQKLILAASAGILAGAATNTVTIQAADGSKARLTATVDVDGNRTVVIKDATG